MHSPVLCTEVDFSLKFPHVPPVHHIFSAILTVFYLLLIQLMLQDVHTKQTLTFDFSEFVGETVGDHCKELPAIHPDQTILPGKPNQSCSVCFHIKLLDHSPCSCEVPCDCLDGIGR